MRLHVVLGLSSRKADCAVTTVYAGHDGLAMRTAMERSASPLFVVLHNPAGITKNNSRAAANATRIADENKQLAAATAKQAEEIAALRSQLNVLAAENETLRKPKR